MYAYTSKHAVYNQATQVNPTPDYTMVKDGIQTDLYTPGPNPYVLSNPASTKQDILFSEPHAVIVTAWPDGSKQADIVKADYALKLWKAFHEDNAQAQAWQKEQAAKAERATKVYNLLKDARRHQQRRQLAHLARGNALWEMYHRGTLNLLEAVIDALENGDTSTLELYAEDIDA